MISPKKKDEITHIGEYAFKRNDILGEGTYGIVYEGNVIKSPEKRVAIKVINLAKFSSDQQNILIKMTELEIQSQLSVEHPYALHLIEAKKSVNNLYLISELCDCTLEDVIGKISMKQIFKYFSQIIEGMIYINKKYVIHRDLKPGNILIKDGNIKIGDYGFARYTEDPFKKYEMSFNIGSPLYMAPEIYNRLPYSSKCDVWSVGVALYQSIYNYTPWIGSSVKELFENVANLPLIVPIKPVINEKIIDLITKMLAIKEDNRISFEDIAKHTVMSEGFGDDEPPLYFAYLTNQAEFFNELKNEIYENKKIFKKSRALRRQLVLILKKYETALFKQILSLIKNGDVIDLNNKFLLKEDLDKYKAKYKNLYSIAKDEFKDLLEVYESKKSKFHKNFNEFVFNENFEISKEFEKEYEIILDEFLEKIREKFNPDMKTIINDKSFKEIELIIYLKIFEIRSLAYLNKFFVFEEKNLYKNPFRNFDVMLKRLEKKYLVEQIFMKIIP